MIVNRVTNRRTHAALCFLYPASDFRADWIVTNDKDRCVLEQWNLPGPPPTEAAITAALVQMDRLAYRDQRQREYPSVGDQLDALWKGGTEANEMNARIEAVKTKYPKP